jgi:hypothetical protein
VIEQPKTHAWSHCPITAILRIWGNTPKQCGDGRWTSGHEPAHSSSSGTCLSADDERGLWYCSSCESGGGPLALVVSILDSRTDARRWLAEHFGEPPGRRSRSKRQTWSTVVPV